MILQDRDSIKAMYWEYLLGYEAHDNPVCNSKGKPYEVRLQTGKAIPHRGLEPVTTTCDVVSVGEDTAMFFSATSRICYIEDELYRICAERYGHNMDALYRKLRDTVHAPLFLGFPHPADLIAKL